MWTYGLDFLSSCLDISQILRNQNKVLQGWYAMNDVFFSQEKKKIS